MNIGKASDASRLPVKTIRYYEEIGLIEPERLGNGYRSFSDEHVEQLQFIHRSRGLGFSIDECRELLSLYRDKDRASAQVKDIALAKVAFLDQKLKDLTALRDTLSSLASSCRGDGAPDCAILEGLAGKRHADA